MNRKFKKNHEGVADENFFCTFINGCLNFVCEKIPLVTGMQCWGSVLEAKGILTHKQAKNGVMVYPLIQGSCMN